MPKSQSLTNPSRVSAQIKIGDIGPSTGKYATFGEQMVEGATMAADEINAAGGVNGTMLQLLIGDDACGPRQSTGAANRMVAYSVAFVVGHFCSMKPPG